MGLRFRKRIKIAPGVYINLSKSGISTTLGKSGASVNISKKGTRGAIGLPSTGLSYSSQLSKSATSRTRQPSDPANTSQPPSDCNSTPIGQPAAPTQTQAPSLWLFLGVLLMPYFFVWFLLRPHYSSPVKNAGVAWLMIVMFVWLR
jgi:hypothetical protein